MLSQSSSIPYCSLSEYLSLVSQAISDNVPSGQWLRAEINECRLATNGHFYMTLVEKASDDKATLLAKTNAVIWRNNFAFIGRMFAETTGQPLSAGMSVLVKVTPNFSGAFGFSLYVTDIDPAFTMGDLARKRQETIALLKKDGVWDMNHDLSIPVLPQRIAIISSPTAAGYGDFCKHLDENAGNFVFYHHLFPAIMQGNNAPASIMEALDQVFQYEDMFDVLVIIRGGGDSSDLLAFDDYDLASCVAQFPLPVITGIGHQRDESVLDLVANVHCKTPTAVADYLVDYLQQNDNLLDNAIDLLKRYSQNLLEEAGSRLDKKMVSISQIPRQLEESSSYLVDCQSRLKMEVLNLLYAENNKNNQFSNNLFRMVSRLIVGAEGRLNKSAQILPSLVCNFMEKQRNSLNLLEQRIHLQSPKRLLGKGYSLALLNGKILKDISLIKSGDHIEVCLANGKIDAEVKSVESNKC